MTYEQYWFGDPYMVIAYREKHKMERKQRNEEMWVNGIYQLNALTVALNNAFSKHTIKYLDKPLEIFGKTKLEKEQEKVKERQKLIDFLSKLRLSSKSK